MKHFENTNEAIEEQLNRIFNTKNNKNELEMAYNNFIELETKFIKSLNKRQKIEYDNLKIKFQKYNTIKQDTIISKKLFDIEMKYIGTIFLH